MLFSVIIPTYNRQDKIRKCLRELQKQEFAKKDFEVIVVNDGSKDETDKVLKLLKNNLKINLRIYTRENFGPASARNFAIKKAKGKYLLFIDDDIIPSRNLLKEHLKEHSKFAQSAVLGNILWDENIKITPFMKFASLEGYQFAYGLIKNPLKLDYNLFYTSNISLEIKWFKEDLFSEKFLYPACEDSELGYRLQKRGLRIVYNKKAIAYHSHKFSFQEFCLRQIKVGKNLKTLRLIQPKIIQKIKFYDSLLNESFSKKCSLLFLKSKIISFLDYLNISFPKNIYDKILMCYTYLGTKE